MDQQQRIVVNKQLGGKLKFQPPDMCSTTFDPQPSSSRAVSDGGGAREEDHPPARRATKNRCHVCRKKVGLTGFTCRCGGLFCSLHRYSNEHDCTFDYRNLGAEEIRKNNPLVIGEKVRKL
ncbi:ZFAND6 [Cordylochernes scorpioides]|uniref:ZFAND6 n=1 Tax=Cordylochernes scorpioides TaxID=51811 RepID=A0ABY6L6Q7_9ARAC|nr:ZFAND6 [Cordylochernes scorpioides]